MAKLQTESAQASDASQKIFMSTMLGMSWQMAIAVLVPTIGGYKLDEHFGTTPYLTIIGLVLALGGMVAIVLRAIKNLNTYMQIVNPETTAVADGNTANKTHTNPVKTSKEKRSL